MFTAALFTSVRTWKQHKCSSKEERIKKVRQIHTMDTKRDEIGSLVVMWLDLEPVIHSEVNQEEKNKCCMLTHTHGSQKHGRDEAICWAGIDSSGEWTFRHGEGEWTTWEVARTYVYYHVLNRQLVGSCCRAQGSSAWVVAEKAGRAGGREAPREEIQAQKQLLCYTAETNATL